MAICKYCHQQIIWTFNTEKQKWKALKLNGKTHFCSNQRIERYNFNPENLSYAVLNPLPEDEL